MCEQEYLFKVCDLRRKYSVTNKQNKIRVEFEQWSCLLNKFAMIVEIKNHWKY
jgi:hypothetical protein